MKKIFEIVQGGAKGLIFRLRGPDLDLLRATARQRIEALETQGVPCLSTLYSERELLPDTLANRITHGTGKQRRQAKRLMASGKYTGQETLSPVSGRWEGPTHSQTARVG